MIKQITTTVLLTAISTTFAFAQTATPTGEMMGEKRGEWGQKMKEMRQEYFGERKELRGDFREETKEARGEFKEAIKEKRMWVMENASGTATGTRPTPWKDYKGDVKDARKDFRDGMKDMRDGMKDEMKKMMPPRMATLTAPQASAIAAKLGITAEALTAQLASGTKLREIIKDKIKPEEIKRILPPQVASLTRARIEQGFFNIFKSRILGPRQEMVEKVQNEFGEVTETAKPLPSENFFRKLFNW